MRNLVAIAAIGALALSLPAVAKGKPAPKQPADKCGFCYGTENKNKPELDSGLSAQRRKILEVAEGELHSVSDCGGSGGEKKGADKLEEIYKNALQSVYSEKAMKSHVRKANHSKWNGPWSWCGIWAAHVVREAGFKDISWTIGKLKGRAPIGGHKGVKPGDIAFWSGGLNHHDIVEKIDGKTVYTLDGNQECSGIMRKKRQLSNMAGYYNVAND